MSILIGLLPAIGWGIAPIIANKAGGDAMHQVLGVTYGQFIVGIILYLIFHPEISWSIFIWPFIGGIFWSWAQLSQFQSFKLMNVSSAMPISAGLQLAETPLVGVIVWGEWHSIGSKVAGFLAVIVLIVGIVMTNYSSNAQTAKDKSNRNKAIWILIIGSIGYTICNTFPKISSASGLSSIVPQTAGMIVGAVITAAFIKIKNGESYFTEKHTIKNMINGFAGGIGMIGYLVSMNLNGVATAFPLTQLNTVVSTIGGIAILHEHKNKKEMFMTIIGLILILGSAVVVSNLK